METGEPRASTRRTMAAMLSGVPTPTVSVSPSQSLPASMAAWQTSRRKPGSVRVASMGVKRQASPASLTKASASRVAASTSARVMCWE